MSSTSPDAIIDGDGTRGMGSPRGRAAAGGPGELAAGLAAGGRLVGGRAGDRDAGIRRRPARGGADRLPAPPPADAGRRAAWDDRLRGLAGGVPVRRRARRGGSRGDGRRVRPAGGGGTSGPGRLVQPALCLAWLGSNREAVACLERVVELEAVPAPDRAVEAWTLAEVLRQGEGRGLGRRPAVRLHDRLGPGRDRFAARRIPGDPAGGDAAGPGHRPGHGPGGRGLRVAGSADTGGRRSRPGSSRDGRRLAGRPGERDGRPVVADAAALQPAGGDAPAGRGATVLPARDRGRGIDPAPREASPLPLPFLDADVWTVRMPGGLEPSRAEESQREWVEHYYENLWTHRPRQGLGGLSPMAAAEAAIGGMR